MPGVESGIRHVVFHYHIFKNAGSTVDGMLRKHFGDASCSEIEGNAVDATLNAEHLLRYVRENPAIKMIASHQARLPEPVASDIAFYPLVFLRHPIDRVGSVYAFERRQDRNDVYPGIIVAQENDLAGYVKWRLNGPESVIQNFQTLHLSGKDLRVVSVAPIDVQDFRMQLNFFGIVELFPESMARMADYLPQAFGRLNTSLRVENRSEDRKETLEERLEEIEADLGPSLYNELLDKNAFDLELYNKAVSIFLSQCP